MLKSKATPYVVLVFALASLLCGFLLWRGAPDTVKLGGAIGAVLVSFLPALLATPPDDGGGKGGAALVLAIVGAYGLLGISATACTPGQKQTARTALQIAEVACVVANAALHEEEIAKVCGIANDAIPTMRDLLAGARSAGAGAGTCRGDAGVSDAGKDGAR